MINLARVIHSPMLSQEITILRATGAWENGTLKDLVLQIADGDVDTITMRGIITVAAPEDMTEIPEGDREGGAMKVLTTARVYKSGETGGAGFSDVLRWHGRYYRVQSVTPDRDYGFWRAVCTRLLMEDGDDGE